jgi:hypothetical protein
MGLKEFRKEYPEYDGWSDDDLAYGLHEKYGKDDKFEDFAVKIGAEHLVKDRSEHERKREMDYTKPETQVKAEKEAEEYRNPYTDRIAAPIGETPFDDLVYKYADTHNVPATIIKRVIKQESNFDPGAQPYDKDGNLLSSAKGLMQLIDGTAKELGVDNPYDPDQNINGGTKYLRQMYDKFRDWNWALAAYHAGPNAAVDMINGKRPWDKKTLNYVQKIGGVDLREYEPWNAYNPEIAGHKPWEPKPKGDEITKGGVNRTKSKWKWVKQGGGGETLTPESIARLEKTQRGRAYLQRANYTRERSVAMVKEGTIETARNVATGLLIMGLQETDVEKIKTQTKKAYMGALTLTPHQRFQFGQKVTEAVKLKGKQLTPEEFKNLEVKFILDNNKEHNEAIQKSVNWVQKKLASDPKYLETRGFWEDFLRMGPQIGMQVLASLGGGPFAGAIAMGLNIAGSSYEELIAKGVDPIRARNWGLANAMMQAPLEQIGLNKFTKFLKFKKTLLKNLGQAAATEWMTEFLQAHPEAITMIWGANPNKSFEQNFGKYVRDLDSTLKKGAYEGFIAAMWPIGGGAIKMGRSVYLEGKVNKDIADFKSQLMDELDLRDDIADERKAIIKEQLKNVDFKTTEDGRVEAESLGIMEEDPNKGLEKEKDKYKEILETEEEVEETPVEEASKEEAPKKETTAKEKLKKQKIKDKPHTVKDIKELTDEREIDLIIDVYEDKGEKNLNRLEHSRLNAARLRKEILGKTEEQVKEPVTDSGQDIAIQSKEGIDDGSSEVDEKTGYIPLQKVKQDALAEDEGDSLYYKNVTTDESAQLLKEKPKQISEDSEKMEKLGLIEGQKKIGDTGIGTVFSREEDYKNTGGRTDKDIDKMVDNDAAVVATVIQEIDEAEARISAGEWEFQFLFDSVITGAPGNMKFRIGVPGKGNWKQGDRKYTRGSASIRYDETGKVVDQTIFINPEAIATMYDFANSVDLVIAHELIHALYKQRIGLKHSAKNKEFYKKVGNIFNSMPKAARDKFMARAADWHQRKQYSGHWARLLGAEKHNAEMWATIFHHAKLAKDDVTAWEEVMTFILSDGSIIKDLYQVQSTFGKSAKGRMKTIAGRLMKAALDWIGMPEMINEAGKPQTFMDDLLDLHHEYAENMANANAYYAEPNPPAGVQYQNMLDIRSFKGFPSGATSLAPATKEKNGNIWFSPLGHFDITNADGEVRLGEQGFVALDETGRDILKFYSREEAGALVDPTRKIIDPTSGMMASEDLKYIDDWEEMRGLKRRFRMPDPLKEKLESERKRRYQWNNKKRHQLIDKYGMTFKQANDIVVDNDLNSLVNPNEKSIESFGSRAEALSKIHKLVKKDMEDSPYTPNNVQASMLNEYDIEFGPYVISRDFVDPTGKITWGVYTREQLRSDRLVITRSGYTDPNTVVNRKANLFINDPDWIFHWVYSVAAHEANKSGHYPNPNVALRMITGTPVEHPLLFEAQPGSQVGGAAFVWNDAKDRRYIGLGLNEKALKSSQGYPNVDDAISGVMGHEGFHALLRATIGQQGPLAKQFHEDLRQLFVSISVGDKRALGELVASDPKKYFGLDYILRAVAASMNDQNIQMAEEIVAVLLSDIETIKALSKIKLRPEQYVFNRDVTRNSVYFKMIRTLFDRVISYINKTFGVNLGARTVVDEFITTLEAYTKISLMYDPVFADMSSGTHQVMQMFPDRHTMVIRKRDGEKTVIKGKEEVKRKKKISPEESRKIIEAYKKRWRKGKAGGSNDKTLREQWADVTKENDAKRKSQRREVQKEEGAKAEKAGRWDLWRPTDGLKNMTDNALELEYDRVTKEYARLLEEKRDKEDRTDRYRLRKAAVEIELRQRHRKKLREQKEWQDKQKEKAGNTELKNLQYYKREYRKAIKQDAPISHVNFIKSQLFNLMGKDAFYRWSGEEEPVIKDARAKEAQKAKEVPQEKIKEIKEEGGRKVTVLKPYTEDDAEKRTFKAGEKSFEEYAIKTAKTKQEARNVYDGIVTTLENEYIAVGKPLPKTLVPNIELAIKQADLMGAITKEEKNEVLGKLATAIVGLNDDFEFMSRPELRDKTSVQKKLDMWSPIKLRFDAYFTPDDGYLLDGYQITVIDPSSHANKATITLPVLTKEALQKRIAELEDLFKPKYTEDTQHMWDIKSDHEEEYKTEAVIEGHKTFVSLWHRRLNEDSIRYSLDFLAGKDDVDVRSLLGMPYTEVAWGLYDDDGYEIFGRAEMETSFEKGVTAADKNRMTKKIFAQMKEAIKKAMSDQLRGDQPNAFYFTGDPFDQKKNKVYEFMVQRIAKTFGWDYYHFGTSFIALNKNWKPTPEDLARIEQDRKVFAGLHDRNEIDPIEDAIREREDQRPNLEPDEAFKYTDKWVDKTVEDIFARAHPNQDVPQVFSTDVFYLPKDVYWVNPEIQGGEYSKLRFDTGDDGPVLLGEHRHYGDWHLLHKVTEDASKLASFLKDGFILDEIEGYPVTSGMLEQESRDWDNMDKPQVRKTERHVYDNPEMEKQARAGEKGVKDETWWDKFIVGIHDFARKFREFEYLPRDKFGDVQYKLRQLKKAKAGSARRAVVVLKDMLKNLNSDQYHNLQRLAYLMDLLEQVKLNEEMIANDKEPNVTANPYGWSNKDIKREAAKVWELVRQDPKTELAWLYRQDSWFKIRESYAKSMADVGFNVANRLQRTHYFRHQVLDFMMGEHKRVGLQGSNKLAVPTRRSHLRPRGSDTGYAMNLNFLQAEFEIMAQLVYDTQVANTLHEIMERHGSKEYVEGYELYKPREDAVFYMANTIPANLLKKALESGAKEINVPRNQIKQALALGGKYGGYWLPPELAKTLNEALTKKPVATWQKVFFKWPMKSWKAWQLIMPLRLLKYNARNMTGDAEAVFLGNPGVFKWTPRAMADLINWKQNKVIDSELQEWIDRGGQETTLQAQELYEIVDRPEFAKLADKKMPFKDKINIFKHYWNAARLSTDMREMLLRYAAYLKFKDEIKKNKGKPKEYVASIPQEVEALTELEDKAFLMSNDLLGAYDRVSQLGEGIRNNVIPFWSFQEVNAKRIYTMFKNTINSDQAAISVGKKLGALTPIAALKIGKFALKFFFFSLLLQFYNNMVWGDAEDGLPEEMRRRSHVILWATDGKDPQIWYFPRVGIVGDLLEWMGADTLPSDVTDLILGKKNFKEIVDSYNYGVENLKDVTNKVVQGIGPQFKIPAELLTGSKFFPSVWNRQPITDYKKYVLDNFALGQIYDGIAGKPTRKDHWARVAKTAGAYYEDKYRLGWLAIQQKKADYKRKNGLKGRGFIVTDSGQALYNLGLSWRYGDQEALTKYLNEYVKVTLEKYGNIDIPRKMREQWEKLHPLEDLPDIHKKLFIASLDERDQYALGLAFRYYGEIKSGKQFLEEAGK